MHSSKIDQNINLLVEFLFLFKDLVYDERKIGTMWGETSMRHLGKLQFARNENPQQHPILAPPLYHPKLRP